MLVVGAKFLESISFSRNCYSLQNWEFSCQWMGTGRRGVGRVAAVRIFESINQLRGEPAGTSWWFSQQTHDAAIIIAIIFHVCHWQFLCQWIQDTILPPFRQRKSLLLLPLAAEQQSESNLHRHSPTRILALQSRLALWYESQCPTNKNATVQIR